MKHACLIGLAAFLAACSTNVDGLFATDSEGGASGTSNASSSKSGATGPSSGSVAQQSSSAAQQSSAANTSAQTATSTTVAQSSSSSGVLSPTVWCNNGECAPGEICCYYIPAEGQDFCSSQGTCPDENGWIELSCNGPDDCPMEECCGTLQNNTWVDVSCSSDCNGGNQLELCYGDPGACEVGTCTQSMLLGQGYMYCGN
jgi:hypothetical protein